MPLKNGFRPLDVLLVDDDPASLRLAKIALQQINSANRVHAVDSGEKALRFLAQKDEYSAAPRPDVMVLDWNMPRIHGRDVLVAVKADDELHDLPVVVLSTSRDPRDVGAAYGGYANIYVAKEPDFDAFVEVLRSIENIWRIAENPRHD